MGIEEQSQKQPKPLEQAELHITITFARGKSKVRIESSPNCSFKFWMAACEFLLHKVAQSSNAGYERAIELLQHGAMSYGLGEKK